MSLVSLTKVPCSHYVRGEDDRRISEVLAYALGQIRNQFGFRNGYPNAIYEISDYVVRLHAHDEAPGAAGLLARGEILYVVTRMKMFQAWEESFNHAWLDVGRKSEWDVKFVWADSPEWERIWASRLFESDWKLVPGILQPEKDPVAQKYLAEIKKMLADMALDKKRTRP